jgi:hypothetical protein
MNGKHPKRTCLKKYGFTSYTYMLCVKQINESEGFSETNNRPGGFLRFSYVYYCLVNFTTFSIQFH